LTQGMAGSVVESLDSVRMTLVAYTVTCDFVDEALAGAWETWLRDEHAGDVCRAGALDGEVVRIDGAIRIECRYHFASREGFARYLREHAPPVRAAVAHRPRQPVSWQTASIR
jgi:hypothetical protein